MKAKERDKDKNRENFKRDLSDLLEKYNCVMEADLLKDLEISVHFKKHNNLFLGYKVTPTTLRNEND